METGKMTIKEMEQVFAQGNLTEEFLAACRMDTRAAAGKLLRR